MAELSQVIVDELRKSGGPRTNETPTKAQRAVHQQLEELAAKYDNPQDRKLLAEVSQSIKLLEYETLIPGAGTSLEGNFEQWLSYLIEKPPWLSAAEQARNRAAFLDIAEAVATIVAHRQQMTVVDHRGKCPEWLASLVSMWESEAATVLTFNYDQLVELAWLVTVKPQSGRHMSWDLYPTPLTPLAARTGVAPQVYSVPGGFQLFKLHGSVNWWYSGPDGPPTDVVYDDGVRGGSWSVEGLFGAHQISITSIQDLESFIVPPAAVKSAYYNNHVLRAMWREAARRLTQAEELVIMGFSLPPTDMLVSSMLCTSISNDCVITPVDYGSSIIGRVRETFAIQDDSPRLNTAYAGLGDEAIPRWVAENAIE